MFRGTGEKKGNSNMSSRGKWSIRSFGKTSENDCMDHSPVDSWCQYFVTVLRIKMAVRYWVSFGFSFKQVLPSKWVKLVISDLVEGKLGRKLTWKVSWLRQSLSLLRKKRKGNRIFPFSARTQLQALGLRIVNTDHGKDAVLLQFQVGVWHLQNADCWLRVHLGLN